MSYETLLLTVYCIDDSISTDLLHRLLSIYK